MTAPEQPADDATRYANLMAELKIRLSAVKAMAPQMVYGTTAVFEHRLHAESICLQLRKVLELVVFSSLVAHRQRFAAKEAEISQMRKAKKILARLEKMNRWFFPIPLDVGSPSGNFHSFEPYEGNDALTRAELERLYDAVSKVAHVMNPFDQTVAIQLERPITAWVERIERLLSFHFIRLNATDLLLVQMDDGTGKVRVMNATAEDGLRVLDGVR